MPMCQPAYPRGDLSSSEQAGIVAQSPPNRNPVKMASDYAFRIMLIFRNPERNPTQSRLTVMQRTLGVGDRLTVGQRTLTPPVLVRIQLPQPARFPVGERLGSGHRVGADPSRGSEGAGLGGVFFVSLVGL